MASPDSPENPLDRWPLAQLTLDANGDGQFTAADVFERLWALFFLPGDLCLYVVLRYAAPIARWLELSPSDERGFVSGVLSVCAWFVALTVTSITYHYVRDLDRRLSSAAWRLIAMARLRARIRCTLLRQRWRAWSTARQPAAPPTEVREVELSALELRALQLHAGLAAGYTLSVSEVASALRARVYAANELLSGLDKLGLLSRAMGGTDDEISYTLSVAGKALLAARATRRRAPIPSHG